MLRQSSTEKRFARLRSREHRRGTLPHPPQTSQPEATKMRAGGLITIPGTHEDVYKSAVGGIVLQGSLAMKLRVLTTMAAVAALAVSVSACQKKADEANTGNTAEAAAPADTSNTAVDTGNMATGNMEAGNAMTGNAEAGNMTGNAASGNSAMGNGT
jgi:hypothetical protein